MIWKNIEGKIGREDDPLFEQPYFKIIIKTKQEEFEKNGPKMFKAHYEPVIESTVTGSTNLNKSTAHSKEREENWNFLKVVSPINFSTAVYFFWVAYDIYLNLFVHTPVLPSPYIRKK